MKTYLAFPVMLLVAASLSAQVIPHTEAETLSGKKIVLPDAVTGHPAVFIVGFSRAGGDSSGRWGKQLRQEFITDSNVQIYSIAELQDAPKMFVALSGTVCAETFHKMNKTHSLFSIKTKMSGRG